MHAADETQKMSSANLIHLCVGTAKHRRGGVQLVGECFDARAGRYEMLFVSVSIQHPATSSLV